MKTILAFILLASLPGGLAFAADNNRNRIESPSMDDWDDDMWSDWGAPAQAPTKAQTDEVKEPPTGPDLSAPASSFGETEGGVHFRLVRDSRDSEPTGVRKHRPQYKRKRL